MKETLRQSFMSKGIVVSDRHLDLLVAQIESYQQLKGTIKGAKLADYDIGLKHVPGGEQSE